MDHMETFKAEEATQLEKTAVTPQGEEAMALSQGGCWLLVTWGARQCSTPAPTSPTTEMKNHYTALATRDE